MTAEEPYTPSLWHSPLVYGILGRCAIVPSAQGSPNIPSLTRTFPPTFSLLPTTSPRPSAPRVFLTRLLLRCPNPHCDNVCLRGGRGRIPPSRMWPQGRAAWFSSLGRVSPRKGLFSHTAHHVLQPTSPVCLTVSPLFFKCTRPDLIPHPRPKMPPRAMYRMGRLVHPPRSCFFFPFFPFGVARSCPPSLVHARSPSTSVC